MTSRLHILPAMVSLIGLLPLTLVRSLGAFSGAIVWLSRSRARTVTEKNIQACFPSLSEKEQKALAKASLIETGKLGMEMCIAWTRSRAYIDRITLNVIGAEYLKSAVNEGKGVVILGPHMGNWEILGAYLTHYGPMTNMYQPLKKKVFDDIVKKSRQRHGAKLVPTNHRGVASLLKALRNGGIVGVLPDQVPQKGSGDFAPFFEIPAYTMTLVHSLVERTECKVVFAAAIRRKAGFDFIFHEADKTLYSKENAISLTALNKGVEKIIELSPTQYQWEYKRFKVDLPDGSRPVDYKH